MNIFSFSHKKYRANEYLLIVYRFLIVMFLYSAGRIIFFLFNTSMFPNVDFPSFVRIMRGGLMFDISAVLYLNAIYFLLFLLPLPFKFKDWYQRLLKWIFMIFNGLGLAFNYMDIIYYRYILKRTTASVFDIVSYDAGNFKLIFRFLFDFWYIVLIWLITLVFLSRLYSLFRPSPSFNVRNLKYYILSLLSIIVFSGLSVIGMRGGYMPSTRPINMNNAGKYVNSIEEISLVLNTPFCILRTWGKKAFEVKNYFCSEGELNLIYNPVRIPNSGEAMKHDNVVVIILESFSREFVGSLNKQIDNGQYKGYTPFLDSLISRSLVFPNAFANGRKSIDAIPSITASIPALVLPYVISERSGNRINSLAGLLSKEGYQTSFFHGAPNGSMGFDAFAKIAGFQHYAGKNEYGNDDGFDGIWGIWDEPFFQFFADEMNKMKEPFFTTIFSVSSHHPYIIPEKYKERFPEENIPLQKCIRYTDFALEKFFGKASMMPWFKNTLFVITADHCASSDLTEYKTPVNYYAVPLIFYKGDGSLTGKDESLAQQIDIMPSILGYLNYSNPYIAFGNNLFDQSAQRFVINYLEDTYQFLIGDHSYYFTDNKLTAIFNQKEDPHQHENLLDRANSTNEQNLFMAIMQQFNNRMAQDRLVVYK
ncbi:LTA synthase family protein [Dolichospermum sp. ST_sed3]|nr:LTA synthase family protein [Dolichospermum sp. ST_sed3]